MRGFLCTDARNPERVIVPRKNPLTSYADLGIPSSTTFTYRLHAFNSFGSSSYTLLTTVTGLPSSGPPTPVPTPTPTPTTVPNAPFDITAQAQSNSSVLIDWYNNANNASGYAIERSVDNIGPWTVAGYVGANTETFTDTGLLSGIRYNYRVRAYNTYGNSSYPIPATATTL